MNKNFVLSKQLKMFFSLGSRHGLLRLGDKFPVSIKRRYSFSQSIFIYPARDYDFFASREVLRFISLADDCNLHSYVTVENGVPVIEIIDVDVID